MDRFWGWTCDFLRFCIQVFRERKKSGFQRINIKKLVGIIYLRFLDEHLYFCAHTMIQITPPYGVDLLLCLIVDVQRRANLKWIVQSFHRFAGAILTLSPTRAIKTNLNKSI